MTQQPDKRVTDAVAAERERCAKLVEAMEGQLPRIAWMIAQCIRAQVEDKP